MTVLLLIASAHALPASPVVGSGGPLGVSVGIDGATESRGRLRLPTRWLRAELAPLEGLGLYAASSWTWGLDSERMRLRGWSVGGGARASLLPERLLTPLGALNATHGRRWTLDGNGALDHWWSVTELRGVAGLGVGSSEIRGWVGAVLDLELVDELQDHLDPGLVVQPGPAIGARLQSANLLGWGARQEVTLHLGTELSWVSGVGFSLWTGVRF